jgi:hypothetical protein
MALNQQQLEKEGIYEAKSPLPSLLADLEQIEKLALVMMGRKRSRNKLAGILFFSGLIGTVVGGIFFAPLAVLSVLDMIAGIALWISAFFMGGKVTEHPARLNTAKQRIAMIREDASEKAPFSLRLALASKARQVSSEKWAGRRNGKQEFLEESWLSLEGPLLDGTIISDEVTDLTRKRTGTNPRGKTKTKVRLQHLVNVRFLYPKELYGDARPAGQALHGEVKVGHGAILRDVRVTEKAIALKALVTANNDILPTAGMLSVGGYRILNLARRIAAGQRGNTK